MADRQRVAILGGGIAGLSAAYELSETDEYEVTLYTMGWRLGGKGASSCNKALGNRVEEHGLHLWFGFYENAFDLMRRTYAEMDPPQSIEDHFTPVKQIVLGEEFKGQSVLHTFCPPPKPGRPGVGDHEVDFWSAAETMLAWVLELEKMVAFYGESDELHLAFNFPFMFAGLDASALPDVVGRTEELLPDGSWPVWALSNHDVVRFPTRICDEDDAKIRCALLILLTLHGTPVLYAGDEIGMRQVEIPPERVLDVHDRDGARTPMPWGDVDWRDPWLPLGVNTTPVAEQRDDPGSLLTFCRDLIALRRATADLSTGSYGRLETPAGVFGWRRGEDTAVLINLSDRPATLDLGGRILLATNGQDEPTGLGPWEGVVLAGVTRT